MAQIHPSITRRLHHICRGVMSVPEAQRQAVLEYVSEQVVEMERARWALGAEQVRILGEHAERALPRDGTSDMVRTLVATLAGTALWLIIDGLHATLHLL